MTMESFLLSLVILPLLVTHIYTADLNDHLMTNSSRVYLKPLSHSGGVQPVLSKPEAACLLLIGFGGFGLVLAILHRVVRRRIYKDVNELDTTFDAGGNITWSLTAVTVASQFFWPADILHSATLTAKIGIAGPFWYAVGVMANILLFPVFSVSLKTRAPGAKTYLQIFRARFDQKAHIVFSFFAVATTTMIMTCTLLSGRAMIQSLVEDVSDEFSLLVMAFLFGSYSLVGGLGTTFYVSYFNASLVFVVLIVFAAKIAYFPSEMGGVAGRHLGNTSAIYEAISALIGPDGNTDKSFLTFRSTLALLYGTLSVLLATASTFCDQALWQSRIAAKPLQGVWGFLVAGLMWFTVPMTMASATGLSYLVLAYENGSHLLTPDEINAGLVTPLVAESVLGQTGGILILSMGTMALMSTGSGEVMGISSIIVYDIYQVYIKHFRKTLDYSVCILCGKKQSNCREGVTDTNESAFDRKLQCQCISVEHCQECSIDVQRIQSTHKRRYNEAYSCSIHGPYRAYQDELVNAKNWCILFVTLFLIPYGLVIFKSGVDLNWMLYCGSIIIIPCFVPVILSIGWAKATGNALLTGSLCGLVAGVSSALGCAHTLEGGLTNFLKNTSDDFTISVGCYTSFLVSLSVSVIGSLLTHNIKTVADEEAEWEKTRQIDNPLNPWHVYYKHELQGIHYVGRPSMAQIRRAFKSARYSALIGGSVLVGVAMFIVPSILCIFPVLSLAEFTGWVSFTHVWAVIMAVIVIFVAPIEEIVTVLRQRRDNKSSQELLDENGHLNMKLTNSSI